MISKAWKKLFGRKESEKEYRLNRGMKVGKNCCIYSWDTIDGGYPWLINIGDNVFVGMGTIVLCNVHIGNNVVIGAGSVVTHDLPSNGVYAGAPAKYVGSIENYKEKNQKLREKRPMFDSIRPWYDWKNATEEEKQKMATALENGVGFI